MLGFLLKQATAIATSDVAIGLMIDIAKSLSKSTEATWDDRSTAFLERMHKYGLDYAIEFEVDKLSAREAARAEMEARGLKRTDKGVASV